MEEAGASYADEHAQHEQQQPLPEEPNWSDLPLPALKVMLRALSIALSKDAPHIV